MSDAAETTNSRRDAQKLADQFAKETAVPRKGEPSADDLIRKMVVAEKREVNRAALPELEPGDQPDPRQSSPGGGPFRHPRKKFGILKARSGKKALHPSGVSESQSSGRVPQQIAAVVARVRGYRPTVKHTAYAGIVGIFLLSPWLIPITLFVAFWVVLIAYLTLGPDRVAELVVAGWQALQKRRPELAEIIRHRAEEMALRIDSFLDRMPEKWRDGIRVPDFSADQGVADDRPDPFERLTNEAPQG